MEQVEFYVEKDFSDGMQISSVSEFMKLINNIQTDNNDTICFRGQETEFWSVLPSVFRDSLLSVEHKLLEEPLYESPYEFNNTSDMFDVMTKYQHYNMCTRLLDLTTNPLVALYFACKEHGAVKYRNEDEKFEMKEPYGVIYYNKVFPKISDDENVKIVVALSKMKLTENNDIGSLLHALLNQSIITKEEMERWSSKEYYREFVDILQKNYVVRPKYSNDRLTMQSGMFLLAGCFNVFEDCDNPEKSVITKGVGDLKEEFHRDYFYICGEDKSSILKELDMYNINESTLFPELEYKLNYIKNKNKEYATPVSAFVPLQKATIISDNYDDNINEVAEETYRNLIAKAISALIEDKSVQNMILEIAVDVFKVVDWYKKESIISSFRRRTAKLLMDNTYSLTDARNISSQIFDEALKIMKNN